MEFKYDLFISYSGYDNKPLANEKGWVTNFSRFLDIALERLLKRRPRILMSHDLEGSQFAKTPPVELFSKTTAFVSIVSPDYVKSKNTQEIEDFITSAGYTGGLEMSGLSRLFKVIKLPVAIDKQPVSIQKLVNYDLFESIASANKEVKEFTSFFDLKAEYEFWPVLVDLAFDVRNLIAIAELGVKVKGSFEGKIIYLSELRGFTSKQRNSIKRELQKFGHKVVPERPMDKASAGYKAESQNYINEATLSVHILNDEEIGRSEKAVTEAQNEFLHDFDSKLLKTSGPDKGSELPKLVWISPEIKPENEKQQALIEQLKKEIEAVDGAEIIQTPFEVFKSIIHEKIDKREKKTKKPAGSNKRSTYLVYSYENKNKGEQIAGILTAKDIEVLNPLFEGDILKIVEKHRSNLVEADSLLIYYGDKDSEQWLKSKLIDMQKAPGFGRIKPLLAKGVVLGAKGDGNNMLQQYEMLSIPETDILNSINPFLNQIKP